MLVLYRRMLSAKGVERLTSSAEHEDENEGEDM